MENVIHPNKNFNFNSIEIKTPKALQGGTYSAKLYIDDEPIIVQFPRCFSKNGIKQTGKKIYCDLKFNSEKLEFIQWLRTFEESVKKLIFQNVDLWFSSSIDIDDIEYFWNSIIKEKKSGQEYLVKTLVQKNKKNNLELQIWDEQNDELQLSDIKSDNELINIIEISELRFSSHSFQIILYLRQTMVFNKKKYFNKCLINIDSNKQPEYNKNTNIDIKNENDMGVGSNVTSKEVVKTEGVKTGDVMVEGVKTRDVEIKTKDINNINIDEEGDVETEEKNKETLENKSNNTKRVEQDDTDEESDEEYVEENDSKSVEDNDDTGYSEDEFEDDSDEKNTSLGVKTEKINQYNSVTNKPIIDKNELLEIKKNKEMNKKKRENLVNDLEDNLNSIGNLDECGGNHFQSDLVEVSLDDLKIKEQKVILKKPNEIYKDLYYKARKRARESRKEAIEAFLDAKNIKQQFLMDEILEISDDEDDFFTN